MTRSRSGSKRCAKARCEGAALDELGCTGLVLCLVVSEREPRAAAARGGRTRARGAGVPATHTACAARRGGPSVGQGARSAMVHYASSSCEFKLIITSLVTRPETRGQKHIRTHRQHMCIG